MQILGIELQNYAGITKQYVPLTPGLRLLVGKNNSGKSATLNFINWSNSRAILDYTNGSLITYCVIVSVEDRDIWLAGGDEIWLAELVKEHAFIRFWFQTKFDQHNVNFNFLHGQLHAESLGDDGKEAVRRLEPEYSERITRLSEKTLPDEYKELRRQLLVLRDARLISPHRTIEPVTRLEILHRFHSEGTKLASYLQTLNSEERPIFQIIEQDFCRVFPEFDQIDLVGSSEGISIYLRHRANRSKRTPIVKCGNGLEQALIILSAVHGGSDEGLNLLDEPHNFLHPSAERRLLEILRKSPKRIIAATHSPILINGVHADAITLIAPPGEAYEDYLDRGSFDSRTLALSTIGFRNSDALFHDCLVFVEGPSDAEMLPILLRKIEISEDKVENIGFPLLEGVEELKNDEQVRQKVSSYEKLLSAIGEHKQKHIYLFDGDRDRFNSVLKKTRIAGKELPVYFTRRTEIESYLLDPPSIAKAIAAELRTYASEVEAPSEDAIFQKLQAMFEELPENGPDPYTHLYPNSRLRGESASEKIKGSLALASIYRDYGLTYDKRRSGRILAAFLPKHYSGIKDLCAPILSMIESD